MALEGSVGEDMFSESDTNSQAMHCLRCNCKVLLPQKAHIVSRSHCLPHMKKKDAAGNENTGAGETINKFWQIEDMMTFENVGFLRTVDNIKYLICADCEVGPIGYHVIDEPKLFFVAIDRVQYK